MNSYFKTFSVIIPFIALFLLTVCFQAYYLSNRDEVRVINPECPWCEEKTGEDVLYLPLSAPLMRIFSPADPSFLADLLWIRTAYYFGKHALNDQEYPYLFHMLDLITDLSPEWENPYLYGAVILANEADAVEDAVYMVEKGLVHHPRLWNLWFFKGYYQWKFFEDNLAASQALHTASVQPEAPIYLARLSASLATRAGQKEMAVRFLRESIDGTRDPNLRKILIQKLEEVMKNG